MDDLLSWSPRARSSDPDTSKVAGGRADEFLKAHHKAILDALAAAGEPLAAEQIADRGDFKSHVAVNRRLSELVDASRIRRTEHKHKNRSGREAYKYELVA